MNTRKQIVGLLAVAAMASPLAARALADLATLEVGSTTVLNNGSILVDPVVWWADMGEFYGNGRAYVVPVLLPTLPPGASFGSADVAFGHHGPGTHPDALRTGFYGGSAPSYNIDLYGLPRVASVADVLAADHYSGPADASATLLQDAFLDPASPGNRTVIDATVGGEAALAAWLNLMYADGANAGQYVFLRLNPDGVEGTLPWSGYQVMTALAGGSDEKPVLTYSVVPEPAALVLLAVGACGLARRRR